MIKIGIIGFGGIAQSSHLRPHLELESMGKSKLVAVCDICPERFEKKVDINIGGADVAIGNDVKKYTDWKEMLENEEMDMVDICVPTYLHEEVAVGALKAGCHVLCEKPMSLSYQLCKNMCNTANITGKKIMVAQCCRFSSAYLYLKKLIKEGTYGKVKSGVFQRLSPPPVWGWDNWFMDYNRSGGCALDMHIHDIDIIRFILGEPNSVSCFATDMYSGKDIVHSRLLYDNFSVIAIGDWSREGVPFESGFNVAFEKATVIRDSNGVTVYPRGGEKFTPELENINVYKAELEYFIDCIVNDSENIMNAPEDSALSVKLISKLMESAEKDGELVTFLEH